MSNMPRRHGVVKYLLPVLVCANIILALATNPKREVSGSGDAHQSAETALVLKDEAAAITALDPSRGAAPRPDAGAGDRDPAEQDDGSQGANPQSDSEPLLAYLERTGYGASALRGKAVSTLGGDAGAGQAETPQPVEAAVRHCLKIGPLDTAESADALARSLENWLETAFVQETRIPDRTIYWVHIDPQPSLAAARSLVEELKTRRVESFVITDAGPLHNGVSLGVFRDNESAERYRGQFGDIGHPVKIHAEEVKRPVYFLVASTSGAYTDGDASEVVRRVGMLRGNTAVMEVACNDVAAPATAH